MPCVSSTLPHLYLNPIPNGPLGLPRGCFSCWRTSSNIIWDLPELPLLSQRTHGANH